MPTLPSAFCTRLPRLRGLPSTILFLVSLSVLMRTAVPGIYTLDSAEFVIGAAKLGIVHAPGYPLYILLLHLFQQLPFSNIGYSSNVFSCVCLALAALFTYHMLRVLLQNRWLAWITAFLFVWGYYVWLIGLFAEVYAPQLATLALTGWAIAVLLSQPLPGWRMSLLAGAAFGLAVTMTPASIFLTVGIVAAFCAARLRWSQRIAAGCISLVIFASLQLYFPIRYVLHPAYTLAGHYAGNGTFIPVNLASIDGIIWMLTGRQFGNLFFADGLVPSLTDFLNSLLLFVQNTLGFGLLLGGLGLIALYRQSRTGLVIWCAAFLPYLYFYTGYGASDKPTMFGPVFWLWSIPVGFGLRWVLEYWKTPALRYGVISLPLILLVVNFPHLDLSADNSVQERAQAVMQALPTNAAVFGHWGDIVPLEYMQLIEDTRQDLMIYNQFLFSKDDLHTFIDSLLAMNKPVTLINTATEGIQLTHETWDWLVDGYQVDVETVPVAPDQAPLYIYHLHPPLK